MSASSKKKLRKEQQAAVLTEKQLQAQKDAKKLKLQTGIFVVVVAVVLAAAVIGLSVSAFNNSGILERNTAALTVGEHKISAAELNYYYMDTLTNEYQNWYSRYADSMDFYVPIMEGINLYAPLDQQFYDEKANITYADYYTEIAVENAVSGYYLYDLAVAEGLKLTEDEIASIEADLESLSTTASANGYPSVTSYLKSFYGPGANKSTYRDYLEVTTLVNKYKLSRYDGLTFTDDEIAAYDEAHQQDLTSYSYLSYYMPVTDFVDCPASEDDKDHKHSDEELSKARRAAEAAANALRDAKPTTGEELNAAIQNIEVYQGNELATCSDVKNILSTLISNENTAEWVLDASRKSGDMTIFPTFTESTDADGKYTANISGYTFLVYVGSNDNNMNLVNIRHILKSFTGGTQDENGNVTYSEAEKNMAKEAAEMLLDSWLKGGATPELFADLAGANSTDMGSAELGGLYTDVYPGRMVANFNDWCFAEDRKVGDYGIVETEYGYHVMYLDGFSDITYRNYMITNALRDDTYNAWYNAIMDNAKFTAHDVSKVSKDAVIGALFS